MDYRGYAIFEGKNCVTVEGIRDFDPVHTFECGQCFRWRREDDGSHTGVAGGKIANIGYADGVMTVRNTGIDEFKSFWFDYLDLGRDYSEIKKIIMKDEIMEQAISFGHGIRLLKQDIWETLISFIISANNRIPMIMKVVAAISKEYGNPLEYNGERFFSFPSVEKLAASCIEQLQICRGGFRCKYILGSALLVEDRSIDLSGVGGLEADEARNLLMGFPGVGQKVADCTLLYSGTRYDVFPTDVWVKRVMEELYFKREASFKEIQQFASDYFGPHAGLAQQYLFYYARENKIGA